MWDLTVPFLQLVGRAALTYLFLLALLRITGKRQPMIADRAGRWEYSFLTIAIAIRILAASPGSG